MQTMPTTRSALASSIRALVPRALVVERSDVREGTRSMALDAGDPDVLVDLGGRRLRLDHDGEGWLGRVGDEEPEVVRDTEDLAWLLCDLVGWGRPAKRQLRALADEAGAHGDHEMCVIASNAIEGDPSAIVLCAETLAYAADRRTNG